MKQFFRQKTPKIVTPLLGALMIFSLANAVVQDSDEIPEIGIVSWSSDLESAKKESAKSGRPVFLLFQEIPG
jgi:hypothetical protein